MVRTEGIVTYKGSQMLCLQDQDSGMRVFLRLENTDIHPGDRVQVAGLALPDGFAPKLVQALVRKVGRGDLPAAGPLDFMQNYLQSSQDATRGEVESIFEGQSVSDSALKLDLRCVATKRDFYAYLPATAPLPTSLVPGSRVRLCGVIKLQVEEPLDANQVVTAFEMYLTSPADIQLLEAAPWWTARHTLWLVGGLAAVLAVSLGWIGALRRQVRRQTRALERDITAMKEAESKLEAVHKQLLDTSRLTGMAEVATNVLHNVGNVLNSANVSASIVADKVRHSRAGSLSKVVAALEAHADDLPAYLTADGKGKHLPRFLGALAGHLAGEQEEVLRELASLTGNMEHIKEIVSMQQNYARVYGVMEERTVTDLVEDSLRMNAGALERHGIHVIRDYQPVPPMLVDKHKVLQILINLISNAKYALENHSSSGKTLTVRVWQQDNFVCVSVMDNGVGIAPENLTRIFGLGFTTHKNGHGFGLHGGALAAKEMEGSLTAQSEGLGKGATFTLKIPYRPANGAASSGNGQTRHEHFEAASMPT
jgi:signal transduction histidine kinase